MNAIRTTLFSLFCVCLIMALSSSVFFFTKIRERERLIDGLIQTSAEAQGAPTAEDAALALSRAIYRVTNKSLPEEELDRYSRWESMSVFNVTSAVALRYGGFGIKGHSTYGPCGTMSRTLLNALWKLDVPARKLQLLDNAEGRGGGHTMVEFFAGDRWLVISPSDDSFVWRSPDGHIATAEEIKNDTAIFSKIFARDPDYPYRFDNVANIRWEKLPPPVVGAFRRILGEQRFAAAVTPRLYDKPRTLFFITSLVTAALFLLLAYFARPHPKSRRERMPRR